MLASGGGTTDPYLSRIIQARHIYNATGMAVPPWEVGDMPVDWMDAILALQVDVPKKTAKIQRVKSKR